MNEKTKTKKTIPTFSISLDQMYLDTKQPKKHQQRFKKYLLDKQQPKETMTKEVKIYASVKFPKDHKGKKDIHITTLEEHLKKYNELSNVDGNELKLFLNENDAREHFNKINQ